MKSPERIKASDCPDPNWNSKELKKAPGFEIRAPIHAPGAFALRLAPAVQSAVERFSG